MRAYSILAYNDYIKVNKLGVSRKNKRKERELGLSGEGGLHDGLGVSKTSLSCSHLPG